MWILKERYICLAVSLYVPVWIYLYALFNQYKEVLLFVNHTSNWSAYMSIIESRNSKVTSTEVCAALRGDASYTQPQEMRVWQFLFSLFCFCFNSSHYLLILFTIWLYDYLHESLCLCMCACVYWSNCRLLVNYPAAIWTRAKVVYLTVLLRYIWRSVNIF